MLIYELGKNWRGRVDGTGEIEGSTRGPRGPKKAAIAQDIQKSELCFPALLKPIN